MRTMDSAMRRLNFDEPVSRLALLSKRLAKISLLLAVVAVVAAHARGGLARFFAALTLRPGPKPDPSIGLIIFLCALAVAALTILVILAAAASMWIRGRRGVRPILAALAWLALLAPYPAYLIYMAGDPPFLADISTDLDEPPAFATSPQALAGRGGWTPRAFDMATAQAQNAAYPDVKTISLDMEEGDAFKATRNAVKKLRWTIVSEVHPGGSKNPDGHIDAVTHTLALNLPVAITIRVSPGDDETDVDVRVVTRYLPNDLGAGAALVGKLSDALGVDDDDSE